MKRISIHRRNTLLLTLLALSLGLCSSSCDETLPDYQEPDRLLQGSIRGSYVIGGSENSLHVSLTIRNIFEETLQGPVNFQGTIEIVSIRDKDVRKTLTLTEANLVSVGAYNRVTRQLTLDPDASIQFSTSWDLTADDNGRDLRTEFFTYVKDIQCDGLVANRCLARPEDFLLIGDLKVFPQRGPVRAENVFALCFVSRSISNKYCPLLSGGWPCVPPSLITPSCTPRTFEPLLFSQGELK